MSTITLFTEAAAAQPIYFRIWNSTGQVLDFADFTFKALASATTPYIVATERSDMAGTGRSGYTANVNLANVNKSAAAQFAIKVYSNAAPADADNPVVPASENEVVRPAPMIWVEFSELGLGEVVVQAEVSVKDTAGTAAQLSCWLERNGRKLDVAVIDAATTAAITLREHRSGVNLFTLAMTAADLRQSRFEKEHASPNFVDDRQYEIYAEIFENSNTHATSQTTVVIG